MQNLQYAYLIGDLVLLFPVWLSLFIKRKDLRKEMITTGLIMGVLTYFLEYYYFSRDYWKPLFLIGRYAGIEDFLFGFFGVGIASTIYEVIYGSKFAKRQNRKHRWILVTCVLLFISIISFHFATTMLKINSIYSLTLISSIFGLVIVSFRHDLSRDVFMSGVLFGLFYFFVFLIFNMLFPNFVPKLYFLDNISGVYFGGFPIEEILWGISLGFAVGPIYEFYKGLRLKS